MDAADNRQTRPLSLAEAADRLGVCRATARKLIRTGELPAVRIASQWRIRPAAVDALLSPPPRAA